MFISREIESIVLELSESLSALADPVRLTIIRSLGTGQKCVCDLQDQVPVAANLLSYHLRILREAGLVTATRRGRWMDYQLDLEGFSRLWSSADDAGVPLVSARREQEVGN